MRSTQCIALRACRFPASTETLLYYPHHTDRPLSLWPVCHQWLLSNHNVLLQLQLSGSKSPSEIYLAGIRLAGATSDVHIMDVRSGKWEQVVPQGEPPSPRAAHAAAAVGSMVVCQGGIGPAGLASEDLHVLDFTEFDRPRWHRHAPATSCSLCRT